MCDHLCRIRFCTQEIVVFREDLLAKMQRNAIVKPDLEVEPLYRHVRPPSEAQLRKFMVA